MSLVACMTMAFRAQGAGVGFRVVVCITPSLDEFCNMSDDQRSKNMQHPCACVEGGST
jgi:hypothetical protein